jgi:SAM-dependent methyltransferase
MTVVVPESAKLWLAAQRPVSAGSLEGDESWMVEEEVKAAIYHIPKVFSVLDIGCGIGLTSLMLKRHLGCEVSGMDGTGMDDVRSGFGLSKGPWNNTEATREFWVANGEPDMRIYENGERIDRKFDLIISFAAWGWHFPLSTYDPTQWLNSPGYVACDIRRGVEKEPSSWSHLSSYRVNHKRTFCCWRVQ